VIPQRNLSVLSNRLAQAGGRRIPEAVLERDYCLAWFLVGLSRAPLGECLAFKGGTALKRCYFGDYRFSEDLDFTLLIPKTFDSLREELHPAFEATRKASGIRFQYLREDKHGHENSYTFYLGYEGPLPTDSLKDVKVDVTLREAVVKPLQNRPVIRAYVEYDDLPDDALVQVYSLEEIAIEKVVALGDRARNEPRDLYDLWHLTRKDIDLFVLQPDIRTKVAFRGRSFETIGEEFVRKEARLRSQWAQRLGRQVAELPEFDGVFREVRRVLREGGLIL